MGPQQAQPLRVRVDIEAMVMKRIHSIDLQNRILTIRYSLGI